jgi:hypothetical protein
LAVLGCNWRRRDERAVDRVFAEGIGAMAVDVMQGTGKTAERDTWPARMSGRSARPALMRSAGPCCAPTRIGFTPRPISVKARLRPPAPHSRSFTSWGK